MKIVGVDVFDCPLTYAHGAYVMSGGRSVTVLNSTLVRLRAASGEEGWGEVCPLGTTYFPAHAEGVRAALNVLAPAVIGLDPRDFALVNDAMDAVLAGHGFAKSPIDVACWDLAGKCYGVPVASLLGGVRQARFALYVAVPLGPADAMVAFVKARQAEGVTRFQLKLGGDPDEDAERASRVVALTGPRDIVIGDANGGWRMNDAIRAARGMRDLPRYYFEQPCPTMHECIAVRRSTDLPIVLDELVIDAPTLIRAVQEGGAGGVNLKVSKVGGLTKAARLRDLAEELGVQVTIEDFWGGDVVTATSAHLAASTRSGTLLSVSFMNDWVIERVAGHVPRSAGGHGSVPDGPGLGVKVDASALGLPIASFA